MQQIRSFACVLALVGVAVLGSASAGTAQTPSAAAPSSADTTLPTPPPGTAAIPSGEHERRPHDFEHHLDTLKGKLMITDAQADLFAKVVEALRTHQKDMAEASRAMRARPDQPQTVIQRLELRQQFRAAADQDLQHFLAAFKPLYDSMSAEQKAIADRPGFIETYLEGH